MKIDSKILDVIQNIVVHVTSLQTTIKKLKPIFQNLSEHIKNPDDFFSSIAWELGDRKLDSIENDSVKNIILAILGFLISERIDPKKIEYFVDRAIYSVKYNWDTLDVRISSISKEDLENVFHLMNTPEDKIHFVNTIENAFSMLKSQKNYIISVIMKTVPKQYWENNIYFIGYEKNLEILKNTPNIRGNIQNKILSEKYTPKLSEELLEYATTKDRVVEFLNFEYPNKITEDKILSDVLVNFLRTEKYNHKNIVASFFDKKDSKFLLESILKNKNLFTDISLGDIISYMKNQENIISKYADSFKKSYFKSLIPTKELNSESITPEAGFLILRLLYNAKELKIFKDFIEKVPHSSSYNSSETTKMLDSLSSENVKKIDVSDTKKIISNYKLEILDIGETKLYSLGGNSRAISEAKQHILNAEKILKKYNLDKILSYTNFYIFNDPGKEKILYNNAGVYRDTHDSYIKKIIHSDKTGLIGLNPWRSNPNQTLTYVILHELGHHIYFKYFTQKQKDKWDNHTHGIKPELKRVPSFNKMDYIKKFVNLLKDTETQSTDDVISTKSMSFYDYVQSKEISSRLKEFIQTEKSDKIKEFLEYLYQLFKSPAFYTIFKVNTSEVKNKLTPYFITQKIYEHTEELDQKVKKHTTPYGDTTPIESFPETFALALTQGPRTVGEDTFRVMKELLHAAGLSPEKLSKDISLIRILNYRFDVLSKNKLKRYILDLEKEISWTI